MFEIFFYKTLLILLYSVKEVLYLIKKIKIFKYFPKIHPSGEQTKSYIQEYELLLNGDINNGLCAQWYYFSISNVRRGVTYKFNIVQKPDSMYKRGMKPCIFSEMSTYSRWYRGGHDVRYFHMANFLKKKKEILSAASKQYVGCSTLSWKYTATHDNDRVFFAHCTACQPYTYSQLLSKLSQITMKCCVRRGTLCHTLLGNDIPLLTITDYNSSLVERNKRYYVCISGRVHPGETPASYIFHYTWMMDGFLSFIVSNEKDAVELRKHIIFKVVPMLNVDGVICGTTRCSLSGLDPNRQYMYVLFQFHFFFHTKFHT
eukprot:GSMAST32.ASY1.ANO1.1445.1 assembled CDS